MTSKTITDRAGDTLRVSTGSLTALPSEVTIKVIENARDRRHVAAVHVDPRELRAALDEVAPLGKYTRTTPDPDDMDGGVAAALIEKEAEDPDAEVRELRSALARELARGNALQDALDAAGPRPLTPDAITDAAMRRAVQAWEETGELRPAIFAALTTPARPEGAEEIEALLAGSWPIDREGLSAAADDLAMNGVRVVTEEQP